MKIKTLLFSFAALAFFAACNSNATTENTSMQTSTNTAALEVISPVNEVVETVENNAPQIIKYGEDSIWDAAYLMTKDYAATMTKNNANLMEDAKQIAEKTIRYLGSFYVGMDGEEIFVNTKKYTEFGYPFEVKNFIEFETLADYLINNAGNELLIPSSDVKSTDKFYAIFRKNKGIKEFVINRVNNNKIQQEYIYIATRDFFLADILKGQYTLDNTDKVVNLMANESITGFKYFKYFYIKYPTESISNTLTVILSKCPESTKGNCKYLAVENTKIYALKYNANTKSIELYNINNIDDCVEDGAYPSPYENIDMNLYDLGCGRLEIGKLAHTLKLKQ